MATHPLGVTFTYTGMALGLALVMVTDTVTGAHVDQENTKEITEPIFEGDVNQLPVGFTAPSGGHKLSAT